MVVHASYGTVFKLSAHYPQTKTGNMKDNILKQLVDNAFLKIACPLHGNGLYAELQQAIQEAYNLGKAGMNQVCEIVPIMQGTEMQKVAS
jgi:hypothetical protein